MPEMTVKVTKSGSISGAASILSPKTSSSGSGSFKETVKETVLKQITNSPVKFRSPQKRKASAFYNDAEAESKPDSIKRRGRGALLGLKVLVSSQQDQPLEQDIAEPKPVVDAQSHLPDEFRGIEPVALLAGGNFGEFFSSNIHGYGLKKIKGGLTDIVKAESSIHQRLRKESLSDSRLERFLCISRGEFLSEGGLNYIFGMAEMSLKTGIDEYYDGVVKPFILPILGKLSCALESLQRVDIVHRDVKPENVLLYPDGVVKLCDFGISYFFTASSDFEKKAVVGTQIYMSPEASDGSKVTGFTSDVFSLGLTFLHLLEGKPFLKRFEGLETLDFLIERQTISLSPELGIALNGYLQTLGQTQLSEAKNFNLTSMLALNPGERPSLQAIQEAVSQEV